MDKFAGHLRGLRRNSSSSQSQRATTGLDSPGHRTSDA